MKASLQSPLPPMELNSLDVGRPKQAKAGLPSQPMSTAMTTVVKDALIRHYGSLKSAGITLNIDKGQLTRELQTGDFKIKQLDKDPEAKAFVSDALHEAFGDADPKARVRRLLREARQRLDEATEAMSA